MKPYTMSVFKLQTRWISCQPLLYIVFAIALSHVTKGVSQETVKNLADTQIFRTWTDNTGKFKVDAQLLDFENNSARLRNKDGKEISLPVNRLSSADQSFIQNELVKSLDKKLVTATLTASHEVDKRRGSQPKTLELTEAKPTSLKSAPSDLSASPLYGEIALGDADDTLLLVLDTNSQGKPRLIVDRNNDKDLTNDADAELTNDRADYWQGSVTMDVRYKSGSEPYSLTFYQWTQRTHRSIAYVRNTTRIGSLKLGIREYPISIIDETSTADFSKAGVSMDFQGLGSFTPVESEEFIIGDLSCAIAEISPDGTKLKIHCQSIADETRLKIDLEPMHGAGEFVKYYSPQTLTLSKEPPFALKAEPKYFSNQPLYGLLALGDAETLICIVVDEPEDDYWRVFVDKNGDKDLTNDGEGAWSVDHGSSCALNGCLIDVAYKATHQPYALNFSRSNRQADKLYYYRDTMREGKVRIAGNDYRLLVLNDKSDGRFDDLSNSRLILDLRNANNGLDLLQVSTPEQTLSALQSLRLGNSTAKVHSISADGSQIVLRAPKKKIDFDGRLAIIGEKVPDLNFKAIGGKSYVLKAQPKDYDYTILHIWDSRAECLERLPEIARIADRYRNSKIRVVGIYLGDDIELAQQAITAWNLDFVQLWDEKGKDSPLLSLFYNSYGMAAPRVVVLNATHLVVDANANNPWSLEKRLLDMVGPGDSAIAIAEPPQPARMNTPSHPMEYAIPEAISELTHLSFYGQKAISDNDIKKLANAEKLSWLELYGTSVTDEGLAQLANLTQLEALFLGETGISDRGLEKLTNLKNLKCLNIQKNPKITDASFATLRGMKNLEVLNLYGTHITDSGLEALKELPNLKHLNIIATLAGPKGQKSIQDANPGCSLNEYPNEWLPSFGQRLTPRSSQPKKMIIRMQGNADRLIDSLKKSNIQFATKTEGKKTIIELDDQQIAFLSSFQEIEELEYPSATVKGLESIKDMSGLKSLNIYNSYVGDAGVAHLKNMTQLKHLNLWGTEITDVSLERLKGLVDLESLNLLGAKITDRGTGHLLPFSKLSELYLQGVPITDQSLVHIAKLTALKKLNLTGTKVSDSGIAALNSLTELTSLWLDSTAITGEGLATLSALSKLEELRITGSNQESKSLQRISNLKSIKWLTLSNNSVNNNEIAALGSMRALEHLFLSSTSIDDVGVQELLTLDKLVLLGITDTKITDAGLKQLAELKSLRYLYITEKVFSREVIDELKAANPKLQIIESPAQRTGPTRKILLKH
ncbi:MAG: SHD1 domain-containing protein [Pirellula sp.]|nr:SHD1 domain-containing protein [Pirellula sp.]